MKKALLFSLIFATSTVYAAQDKITLAGGPVEPNQQIAISLDQLNQNEHYAVKCSLRSTAPTDVEMMKLSMNFVNGGEIAGSSLNEKDFDWDHAKLEPATDNIIATTDLVSKGNGNSLVFANLSNEFSYTVNSCEAVKLTDNNTTNEAADEQKPEATASVTSDSTVTTTTTDTVVTETTEATETKTCHGADVAKETTDGDATAATEPASDATTADTTSTSNNEVVESTTATPVAATETTDNTPSTDTVKDSAEPTTQEIADNSNTNVAEETEKTSE